MRQINKVNSSYRKMQLKYPKLAGFVLAIILSYVLFSNPSVNQFIQGLGELKIIGAFIAGMFYTFGFSSPFSAGFFIDLNPQSILLTGIAGGIGALIGDIIIFRFAKTYFKAEFKKLKSEKLIKSAGFVLNSFFLYIIAAILIASPLPDEAGITIIAGLTKMKEYSLAIISITLNTIGILILISI